MIELDEKDTKLLPTLQKLRLVCVMTAIQIAEIRPNNDIHTILDDAEEIEQYILCGQR
jgi:hypothetical protein